MSKPHLTAPGQIARGIAAEHIRAGGLRSLLVYAGIPGVIVLPLLITFGIAYASERIAALNSTEISVAAFPTENSAYWVLNFGAVAGALIATYAQASSMRGALGDVDRYLYPRSWTSTLARWLYYGLLTAAVSLGLIAFLMAVLPVAFPEVYGDVDLTSMIGVRFLLTVPIYAFFACGFGIGLAGLIGHPAAAVAVLLFWIAIVEDAIIFIPNGGKVQAYMPFLNGIWGTGQFLVMTPPWGKDGALVWFGAVAVVIFLLGTGGVALRRRPRRARH
ncbi:MAG: ABC transporter permease [Gordonia sp. (in: high G+C Gram-positive bacteria)]|uniref:ABC transporter permease n=1 Tax=Gordonia sp. (in: high G+C Gram-positive bacteria) TaxID=84139 RepID=UPI003BB63DBE